jgi:single-stranded-DNA-specific exonuclease
MATHLTPQIFTRSVDEAAASQLQQSGFSPRMARLFAARGVVSAAELNTDLSALIPPETLTNSGAAAILLADAIAAKQRLLIVADYDADGATACAIGMKALRMMGAVVDFIVPNRFEYGYGLTPEIVRLAFTQKPDWIITVDNGIASADGVAEANRLGMKVLVTDHHLPGAITPQAACIVNPNQVGCNFASKNLAGCGVIFYVMLALRAELRKRGTYNTNPAPNLSTLLDLLALGTVADVVRLDQNNRILVDQGLARIRAGRASFGIMALLDIAGRKAETASVYELGFVIGPRLNAAGRLTDMSLGIACLLAEDSDTAQMLATKLDTLNRERREIEGDMRDEAMFQLEAADEADAVVTDGYTICVYQPTWHQGVIGILASRVRERFHRPVIAFAPDGQGNLKGSGRSINTLHLRDALDLVSKRHPHLLQKFGGHAMAAGLSLKVDDYAVFVQAFEAAARSMLQAEDLALRVETDGELSNIDFNLDFVRETQKYIWGQGFAPPTFRGKFSVVSQKVVGEKHLKLKLKVTGSDIEIEALRFGSPDPVALEIEGAFRLSRNEFRGNETLQLIFEQLV